MSIKDETDFDKHQELSLAQPLVHSAQDVNHKKASYYTAALQYIRCLPKPPRQFKAFFLTLFADNDYTKVLESGKILP